MSSSIPNLQGFVSSRKAGGSAPTSSAGGAAPPAGLTASSTPQNQPGQQTGQSQQGGTSNKAGQSQQQDKGKKKSGPMSIKDFARFKRIKAAFAKLPNLGSPLLPLMVLFVFLGVLVPYGPNNRTRLELLFDVLFGPTYVIP